MAQAVLGALAQVFPQGPSLAPMACRHNCRVVFPLYTIFDVSGVGCRSEGQSSLVSAAWSALDASSLVEPAAPVYHLVSAPSARAAASLQSIDIIHLLPLLAAHRIRHDVSPLPPSAMFGCEPVSAIAR